MKRTHGFFLISSLTVLFALAGCGRSMFTAERAAWRGQAEAQCMQSGAVKMGAGVVQISPIEGPGMCGADFPLKVAALGESPRMSYSDVPRPPGGVANGSQPNWGRFDQPNAPPPSPQGAQMRWNQGPPSIAAPDVTAPNNGAAGARPMSIYPPGVAQPDPDAAEADDVPDDVERPTQRDTPRRVQPSYNATEQLPQRQLPALGPARVATGPVGPATLVPAATLSCPIVSALDKWVSDGVQPAAMRWFGAPVTEIKQISAYSCRGMNGSGGHGISEHAFGNALDVAAFTLADGRKIVVQTGWKGTPEEQGFLHDVQLYACDTFTTVLAPGYNAAHYNHIHVDLMRRANGRRPCRPNAIPGEVVAAKARAVYAAKHGTAYTGSIGKPANASQKPGTKPTAVPGADGLDDDDAVTGTIAAMKASPLNRTAAGDDGEFEDEDTTGSIAPPSPPPKQTGWPRLFDFKPASGRSDNPANH